MDKKTKKNKWSIFKWDVYQQLRLRRMLLAIIGAITFTIICYFFNHDHVFRIKPNQFWHYVGIFWAVNFLFVILMVSGLNKKFSDPSLTTAQMIWAISATMFSIYLANEGRTPLLMMTLLAIMFGGLDYSRKRVVYMTFYSIFVYAWIVFLLKDVPGAKFNVRKELVVFVEYVLILLGYNILLWEMIVTRLYLKNKSLYLQSHLHQAEIESITDSLTGVGNRRFLQKVLQGQLYMAARSQDYFFAISMMDIDFFKYVNDHYGHDVGDKVLQRVSFIINNHLRQSDTFGRFGGEEFIIISPLTDANQAVDFAERIRKLVEKTVFRSVTGLSITVSIGVTLYKNPEPLDDTLKRVDKALYRAKEEGRNRVITL